MSLFSCRNEAYQIQDCDLIFRIAEENDFSKAITDATAQKSEIKFDHVGILIFEEGDPKVLETNSTKGVVFTNFEDFIHNSSAGYVIKRVIYPLPTKRIIQEAKSHLGEAYDWSFLPNNGKMYCSELVYESFVTKDGSKLFETRPMNFKDANGNIPQFWTDLFKRLEIEIPQGIPGTNPNDIAHSPILEEVFQEIPCNKD